MVSANSGSFRFRLRTLCLVVAAVAAICAAIPWWSTTQLVENLTSSNVARRQDALSRAAERKGFNHRIVRALIESLEYESEYEDDYERAFFDSYAGPIPPDGGNTQTEILASLGNVVIPDLLEALQYHEDRDVRRFCVVALRSMQDLDEATLGKVWEALDDSHWGVVEQAVFTLLDHSTEEDSIKLAERFGELLEEESVYVRFAAIGCLERMSESTTLSYHTLSCVLDCIQNTDTQHDQWYAIDVISKADPSFLVGEILSSGPSEQRLLLESIADSQYENLPAYVEMFEKLKQSEEVAVRSIAERLLSETEPPNP